jgi:biopolymer transport protein ExbD
MRRRRKKHRQNTDAVELNLAAMLDMAFQLLTFFILTFKPAPVEGQLSLRLPPPEPVAVAKANQPAGSNDDNPVAGVESLIISVFATPSGKLESMAVGEMAVGNLKALDARLESILGQQDTPFEQIVIQVSSSLRYQDLMEVVNVCAEQHFADGKPLTKLSFVELPEAAP